MKLIKSFFLLIVGFCTTTILYAQELQPEIAKPIEVKILPAAVDNKPSPVSQLKPQPGPGPKETTLSAVAETPSPLTRKENVTLEEKEKLEVKTLNAKDIATPGGEEGRKTLAGKTTRPTPEINNQSTIDPRPAPQVKPAKPVNGKQQQ
jgi:hypothetical protein